MIAWSLAVLMTLANVAGYAFDLYAAFWWFDRVLHACTLFAVTLWLALLVFARALRPEHGRGLLAFLLFLAVGVACGALWEVAEWVFDLVWPADVIKGKFDTIIDIIMDTVGTGLAAALAVRLLQPIGHG